MIVTPSLLTAVRHGHRRRALALLSAAFVCYASTRFDPTLRREYHFRFLLERARSAAVSAPSLRRAASLETLRLERSTPRYDGEASAGGGGRS